MSVIITNGYINEYCDRGREVLNALGVKPAITPASKEHTPTEISDRFCMAHNVNGYSMHPVENYSQTGADKVIQVGKAWEYAYAELFLANALNAPWGWADTNSLYLVDFLKNFDPNCKFLMVYASPAETLALRMGNEDFTKADFERELPHWQNYHRLALSFYQENRDRSALVHVSALDSDPKAFSDLVEDRFCFDVRQDAFVSPSDETIPLLQQLLSYQYCEPDLESTMIFEELENSADLPSAKKDNVGFDVGAAWGELRESQTRINKLESRLTETEERATRDLAILQNELDTTVQDLADCSAQLSALRDSQESIAHRVEEAAKQANVREEKELILLQLEQAKEELEHYYVQCQKLKQQAKERARLEQEPTEVAADPADAMHLDMRKPIEGENWYDAELDGRWAGPGSESILKLPRLIAGEYELEIAVVDSMSAEILEGLQIWVDDRVFKYEAMGQPAPRGMLAPLRNLKAAVRKPPQRFPVRLLGLVDVDERAEGHKLTLRFPATLSPDAHGSKDTRELTARIGYVSMRATGMA